MNTHILSTCCIKHIVSWWFFTHTGPCISTITIEVLLWYTVNLAGRQICIEHNFRDCLWIKCWNENLSDSLLPIILCTLIKLQHTLYFHYFQSYLMLNLQEHLHLEHNAYKYILTIILTSTSLLFHLPVHLHHKHYTY